MGMKLDIGGNVSKTEARKKKVKMSRKKKKKKERGRKWYIITTLTSQ